MEFILQQAFFNENAIMVQIHLCNNNGTQIQNVNNASLTYASITFSRKHLHIDICFCQTDKFSLELKQILNH